MNTQEIKSRFVGDYHYTMPEGEFINLTGFKELKEWDVSGRDDCTSLFIGTVDGRFF